MDHKTAILLGALLCGCATAATAGPAARPEPAALAPELASYLDRQGDLCLGKFDWPVNVTAQDVRFGTRDALQMPVLQKLGLVASNHATLMRRVDDVEQPVAVTQYTLTDAGNAFYLAREGSAAAGTPRHDLCAGRLSLDKVVDVSAPVGPAGHEMLTASYTYRYAPAPWGTDPDVQRVFPALARIAHGIGTQRLNQPFELKDGRWVAVNPWQSR
jgi:hypothetical protein